MLSRCRMVVPGCSKTALDKDSAMIRNQRDDFDSQDEGIFAAISNAMSRTGRIHGRGSLLTFMVVLAMIAILVTVLWYSYPRESASGSGQAVPLIRAENQPFRVEPDDRGGTEVPYRDSTIFQTLRDDGKGTQVVENLLDDESDKVDRSKLFAGLNTRSDEAPAALNLLEENEGEVVSASTESAAASQEKQIADVSLETRTLVQSVLKEHEKSSAQKEQEMAESLARIEPAAGAATPAAAIPNPSGNYFIQLASVKTREAAEQSWPGLQKKHAELSGSKYRVQEADLGERGKFYRIQAGPYDQNQAGKICEAIKSRNPGGCLVVSR